MRHRVSAALVIGGLLIVGSAACSSARTYPNKPDNSYDLGAMSLTAADVPAGFDQAQLPDATFDNQAWAQVMGATDPQATQNQLDAQGRIKSYVAAFQAQQLGKVLSITSISTLYKDTQAASTAEKQYACGIPIDLTTTPIDPFAVPKLGDQSFGFLSSEDRGQGQSFSDTNFCFRTGRIVNVVQQTSLPGVEDIALNVRLAEAMLQHVNDAFDGKPAPPTPTPTPGGVNSGGGQLVPLTPGASGTATGTAPGGASTATGNAPGSNGTATGSAPAGNGTAPGGTGTGNAPAGNGTPQPGATANQ